MKLLAGLVASSLVTAVTAASHVVHLSQDETRLLLAERLGVSRFHELQLQGGDIHKTTQHIASAFEGGQGPVVDAMFAETKKQGGFVLSLAGMKDARLDSALPSMIINDDSPTSSVADLLARLAAEKAQVLGQHQHVFSETSTGSLCVSVPELEAPSKSEDQPFDSDLQSLLSTLDAANPSQSQFLAEFNMIRAFMVHILPSLPSDGMAYCHAPGLSSFIAAHGSKSHEAATAAALYTHLLASLPSSITSTVLLLPSTAEAHSKRDSTEAPLSMPHPEPSSEASSEATTAAPPKHPFGKPVALCHNSKEACETSTRKCSGRGSCGAIAKGGQKTCFACRCKPTVVKNGDSIKTTYWAGAACQKKDVSVPFNIFLGLGIVLVFVMVAVVGLLSGVGDVELPSVLSAGVPPAKHT